MFIQHSQGKRAQTGHASNIYFTNLFTRRLGMLNKWEKMFKKKFWVEMCVLNLVSMVMGEGYDMFFLNYVV